MTEIIENIIKNGDKALFEYGKKFDKAELESLEVSEEEFEEAFRAVDDEFLDILEEAAENIREYHRHQVRDGFEIRKDN